MNKDFEKKRVIYLVIILVLVLFFIMVFYISKMKISKYKVFSSVVVHDDLLMVVVDKKDKKLFFKNSHVFLDGEKKSFVISKIDGESFKDKYILYLEMSLANYEDNDVVMISILEKKIYSFKIFDVIWR